MKYGFVYIWRDKGKRKWYIGCRWGNEDDGYICSSKRMKTNYKSRPEDFRRRILISNIESKEETLNQEFVWLSMIKKEELGKKYYNLANRRFFFSISKEHHSEETKKIMSEKVLGRVISEEQRNKISNSLIGHIPWNKGIECRPETKEKLRKSNTGKQHTQETIEKIASRRGWKHSEDSIEKMRQSKIGSHHSSETIEKMRISARNRKGISV